MADDIRALTAALARDPASLAYVELGEALRRRGQLEEAARVLGQGLERHPHHAEGHDGLARVHADRGELELARAGWERVLGMVPEHPGALKGLGYVFWRLGDARRAADALQRALLVDPSDEGARRALEAVRRGSASGARKPAASPAPPEPPAPAPAAAGAATSQAAGEPPLGPPAQSLPAIFVGLEGAAADILLLDARGLVLAGGVRGRDGSDVSELAAAALGGVSGEAARTAAYLGVGAWSSIVVEADAANVVLVPVAEDAALMVRRDRSTPAGLALRVAERARGAALAWLESQGA